MAKLFGLNGYASGKLGNTVLAVYNGTQVARQYQPIVNNPKSPLQNQQRAKGNLAGRMSGFVPQKAISGLGRNNRERRGEFLRNILKGATVTSNAGVYNAKIASEDILFSKGALASPFRNITVGATAHTVSVNLVAPTSGYTAEEWARLGSRIVVLVYDSTSQDLVECATVLASMPTYPGGNVSSLVNIGYPDAFEAEIYIVPMSTSDGSNMAITTDMVGLDDNAAAAALSVNGNAVVFDYGRSLYIGRGVYTPA